MQFVLFSIGRRVILNYRQTRQISILRNVNRQFMGRFRPNVRGTLNIRPYSTSVIPRGLFLRTFWAGATAVVGYTYYQITQATGWLSEQIDILGELGLEGFLHALDVWEHVSQITDNTVSRWNPFSWKSKVKEGINNHTI